MQPPTTVRFTLTRTDLFRARLRSICRNRVLWMIYMGIAVFLIWSTLSSPGFRETSPFVKFLSIVIAISISWGAGALGMLFVLFAGIRRKNKGIVGEHEIQITEAGLIERTDANENISRWTAFHKMVITRTFLYLFVTDTQYHLIPLRYFESPDHLAAFQSEIKKHLPSRA